MRTLSAKIMILTLGLTAAASAGTAAGIPHRQVADMLYELAFASRKVYTRDIVQRLTLEESVITASEHFMDTKGLPLPAQMFRFAAEELLENTDDSPTGFRCARLATASGPLTSVEERSSVMANPPLLCREQVFGRQTSWRSMRMSRMSRRASHATGHPESPA